MMAAPVESSSHCNVALVPAMFVAPVLSIDSRSVPSCAPYSTNTLFEAMPI